MRQQLGTGLTSLCEPRELTVWFFPSSPEEQARKDSSVPKHWLCVFIVQVSLITLYPNVRWCNRSATGLYTLHPRYATLDHCAALLWPTTGPAHPPEYCMLWLNANSGTSSKNLRNDLFKLWGLIMFQMKRLSSHLQSLKLLFWQWEELKASQTIGMFIFSNNLTIMPA